MEKKAKREAFWIKYFVKYWTAGLGILMLIFFVIIPIKRNKEFRSADIYELILFGILGIASIIFTFWQPVKFDMWFKRHQWFWRLVVQGNVLFFLFLKEGFSIGLILMIIIIAGLNYLQYRSESKVISNDKQ